MPAILVVDDDPLVLAGNQALLTELGCDVTTVSDGPERAGRDWPHWRANRCSFCATCGCSDDLNGIDLLRRLAALTDGAHFRYLDFRRHAARDDPGSEGRRLSAAAQARIPRQAARGGDAIRMEDAQHVRRGPIAMKILLADDHALIRSGLRNELVELDADVEFVEAWDADSLRQMFDTHDDLDLALVDLTMPGMDGAQTIGDLRQDFPDGAADRALRRRIRTPKCTAVLRAGAAGFIPKIGDCQGHAAGDPAGSRGRAISAAATDAHARRRRVAARGHASQMTAPAESRRLRAGRLGLLSPRQREVFALLAKGLSNKMIARELNVTEGTVKSHVATIFDVLNVHNRVSAVAEAQRLTGELDRKRLADR